MVLSIKVLNIVQIISANTAFNKTISFGPPSSVALSVNALNTGMVYFIKKHAPEEPSKKKYATILPAKQAAIAPKNNLDIFPVICDSPHSDGKTC